MLYSRVWIGFTVQVEDLDIPTANPSEKPTDEAAVGEAEKKGAAKSAIPDVERFRLKLALPWSADSGNSGSRALKEGDSVVVSEGFTAAESKSIALSGQFDMEKSLQTAHLLLQEAVTSRIHFSLFSDARIEMSSLSLSLSLSLSHTHTHTECI